MLQQPKSVSFEWCKNKHFSTSLLNTVTHCLVKLNWVQAKAGLKCQQSRYKLLVVNPHQIHYTEMGQMLLLHLFPIHESPSTLLLPLSFIPACLCLLFALVKTWTVEMTAQ